MLTVLGPFLRIQFPKILYLKVGQEQLFGLARLTKFPETRYERQLESASDGCLADNFPLNDNETDKKKSLVMVPNNGPIHEVGRRHLPRCLS